MRILLNIVSDNGPRRIESHADALVLIVPLTADEATSLGITRPDPAVHVWTGPNDDRHTR